MTFTHNALLENPIAVGILIKQLQKHPFWDCYLLPSVLTVFVRMASGDEDPATVFLRQVQQAICAAAASVPRLTWETVIRVALATSSSS